MMLVCGKERKNDVNYVLYFVWRGGKCLYIT